MFVGFLVVWHVSHSLLLCFLNYLFYIYLSKKSQRIFWLVEILSLVVFINFAVLDCVNSSYFHLLCLWHSFLLLSSAPETGTLAIQRRRVASVREQDVPRSSPCTTSASEGKKVIIVLIFREWNAWNWVPRIIYLYQ